MKQIFLPLILLTLTATCGHAQTTLTLQQARELATQHNKDVAIQQAKLEQTTYDAQAIRSNFLPRVNLMAADLYSTASGSFNIDGGHLPIYTLNPSTGTYVPSVSPNADGSYTLTQYADFPSQKFDYKIRNVLTAGITLQQPLYMGGKISTAYRMARLGTDMAGEAVRLSRQQLRVDADRAYIQAVEAQEMKTVARSYEQLLQELLRNVQSAVNHGLRTRNDLMKVQVKLNEAQQASLKADNAYTLARMNLCHIIGMPLTSSFDVDTLLPTTPPLADNANIRSRPEAAVYDQKLRMQQENVRLERSNYLPKVALFAGVNYTNGIKLANRTLMDDINGSVGVTIQIPVLTFGESTNKIRAAKAQQRIAQLEQQDIEEKLTLEATQALHQLTEAQSELVIAQRSRAQAAENLRLSRKQYEVGYETLSDHLDAQSTWQSAYASEVRARCQLFLATTLYQKAAGLME